MNDREWFLEKNSKRPNRAYIWNETYRQGCYILWPVTSEMLKIEYLHVNKHSEFRKDRAFKIDTGKFLSSNNLHCLAFAQDRPSAGLIAHECLHLSNFILDDLGLYLDADDDEAHAYFMWWMVDRIFDLTRHKK